MSKKQPSKFRNECGDSFVAVIYSGAELSTLLSFSANSLDEKQSITVNVEGSGWGVEAGSNFSKTLEKYQSASELSIDYIQSGGSGDPIPTDSKGIISAIQSLPNAAKNDPKKFNIVVQSYGTLPSWASKNPWSDFESAYDGIVTQYAQLQTVWDTADYILAHQDQYIMGEGVTEEGLKSIKDAIFPKLKGLQTLASSCIADRNKCSMPPSLNEADYNFRIGLPAKKGSFREDLELSLAMGRLEKLKQQIAAAKKSTEEQVQKIDGLAKDQIRQLIRDSAMQKVVAPLIGQMNGAAIDITILTSKRKAALPQAILNSWVRPVAKTRCASFRNQRCLTEGEIDEFLKKIKVS